MDFRESFTKQLALDLESGRYADADDFAAGITKHYLNGLALNAPMGIPLTMPAPALQGAAAPVGPGTSISNRTREKIFYNTIRTYFLGKEISQGKIRVKSLGQDIRGVVLEYNKLTTDINNLQTEFQAIEDKLRELREQVRSLKPELKKFIQTKKNTLKDLLQEVRAVGGRFNEQKLRGLSEFDFNTVMADELKDLEAILNLKIEPSISFSEIQGTFQTLAAYMRKAKSIKNKYKNVFTNEANLKTYITKKLSAVVKEIMDLLNAILKPEKFVNLWKELLYIPGGKVIGKIMLQIINNNEALKEKKKQLLQKLEAKKVSVRAQLDKKLEDLQDILQKSLKSLEDKIKNLTPGNKETKDKQRRLTGKKVKAFADNSKRKIKKVRNAIRHYQLIINTIQSAFTKLYAVYELIRSSVENSETAVADIKQKVKDGVADINQSFSQEAQQQRQQATTAFTNTNFKNVKQDSAAVLESLGDATPIVGLIIDKIQDTYKLNPAQVEAFLRTKGKKIQDISRNIETILAVDLPKLQKLFQINPNSPYYQQQLEQVKRIEDDYNSVEGGAFGVVGFVRGEPDEHITYLKLIKSCRVISDKIDELQFKVQTLISDKEEELVAAQKEQQYLDEYLNTMLEINPTAKKTKNKKRKAEFDIAKQREKVVKLQKTAKKARLAYNIVTTLPPLVIDITQTLDAPITNNEKKVQTIIDSYLELQIERGKITPAKKQEDIKAYNRKIADLKAYEQIYTFFREVIAEGKKTKISDQIKKIYEERIKNKAQSVAGQGLGSIQVLLDILSGVKQNPTLLELAEIPAQLFTQGDAVYSIIRAQKTAFKRLRVKAQGLTSFIPQDTEDPGLLTIRYHITKGSDFIVAILDAVALFFKKVSDFFVELYDEVIVWLRKETKDEEEKIKEDSINFTKAKADSKINLDARIMSFVFNLAGKLYWVGNSWTNTAGTRFVVTGLGRFYPNMEALSENGAQGYAEEMGEGFNSQLNRMSGLAIPPVSLGIPPFTWRGYLSKQDYIMGYPS